MDRARESPPATAKPVLPTKYWFPLLVALVVTGAILLVSELSYRTFSATRGEMSESMALNSKLLELQKIVLEAETGQRGFLLTRRAEYLEPYNRALAQIGPVRERLRDLAATDRGAREHVAKLNELVTLRLAEIQRTLERAHAGDFDGALAAIDKDEGRQLMLGIDKAFSEFAKHNETVLTARAHSWEESMDSSRSGILAVVALNATLIALLALVLIRDTRRARENDVIQASFAERMNKEVGERTAQLSSLSEFLQTQSEAEKAKLARELHDELGGILTPAKMDVNWLEGRLGTDREIGQRLVRLSALLDSGIDVKRRIIENLRPSILDHLGLAAALRWHIDETCKSANLEYHLDFANQIGRLPPDVEIALYRVAQEAITNVVRHARAKRLDVVLERTPEGVILTIRDDGVGIADLQAATFNSYGMGSMRQRVSAVGGTLDIDTGAGSGTRLRAFVPQGAGEAPSVAG